jgi:hypothetical protein
MRSRFAALTLQFSPFAWKEFGSQGRSSRRSSGIDTLVTRVFNGHSCLTGRKSAFFQPFLRFFLAFYFPLGYSAQRPEFFRSKTGVFRSRPASIVSGWKENTGG